VPGNQTTECDQTLVADIIDNRHSLVVNLWLISPMSGDKTDWMFNIDDNSYACACRKKGEIKSLKTLVELVEFRTICIRTKNINVTHLHQ